jgi:hypothetical protein
MKEFIVMGGKSDNLNLMEKLGLEKIFSDNTELEVVEIGCIPGIKIPDNLTSLKSLKHLALMGVENIPENLKECTQLELLVLCNIKDSFDIASLSSLPNLTLVNIAGSPNITGWERLVEDGFILNPKDVSGHLGNGPFKTLVTK